MSCTSQQQLLNQPLVLSNLKIETLNSKFKYICSDTFQEYKHHKMTRKVIRNLYPGTNQKKMQGNNDNVGLFFAFDHSATTKAYFPLSEKLWRETCEYFE